MPIDEIFELDQEFEIVNKTHKILPFPVIYIFKQPAGYVAQFNTIARQIFPSNYITFGTTPKYIICQPGTILDPNSYSIRNTYVNNRRVPSTQFTFPSSLIDDKKVIPGHYKLYKYKDGFVFKRFEPLD